ncbi:MAG: MOSC domain-containing protein [Acidobacteriota bacterium]
MTARVKVASLHVYPVKGCRGIAVGAARVGERGFERDRQWMVVDAAGRFVSQRTHPELARVTARLENAGLCLEAEGCSALEIPLAEPDRPRCEVEIWGQRVEAVTEGEDASRWFGTLLGEAARLVRLPSGTRRCVDPRRARPGDQVGFADGYPFLLVSEGSLDELNRRLARPVGIDRFRANIVIEGCLPHEEDEWSEVRIGGIDFRVVKPCARCVVVTTDQRSGERDPEPLRAMSSYRSAEGKVLFGQNLIHDGRGPVRVGDAVQPTLRAV